METELNPFLPDGRQWAWNSSSLGPAKTCARKYYYSQILGYVTKGENAHITFGSIYAGCLEHYHHKRAESADHNTALTSAVKQALQESWGKLDISVLRDLPGSARNKTRENLIRSIVWYLDEYEDDACQTVILANGQPAVELSFKFKLENEVWLCGHIDRLVTYSDDNYVQDQKTTGTSIGQWYFKRFNPDNQMSLYTIAGEVVWNTPVKGVMIDAAQIAVGFTRFERGFTFRTAEQNAEWLRTTIYHIERIWEAKDKGYPMNDSACQQYGGCPYIEVCAKSPSVRRDFLDGGAFEKHYRNPLGAR